MEAMMGKDNQTGSVDMEGDRLVDFFRYIQECRMIAQFFKFCKCYKVLSVVILMLFFII
jgi:hypothetical protein